MTPGCGEVRDGAGRPLSVVVIGLGSRGRKHAAVIEQCSAVRLVGVCDTDPAALAPFVGRVLTATRTDRLLGLTEPDAAVLVLPHEEYLAVVEQCATRQVACLKEKPLARDLDEARQLRGILERTGSPFAVAVQRRHGDVVSTLDAEVKSQPGGPVAFEYLYTLGLEPTFEGWRTSPVRAGGGAILDMGYHVIDMLTDLFGIPESVAACPERRPALASGSEVGVEDGATLMLRYATGMTGAVVLSRCLGPATERATFWLEDASLHFDGERLERVDGIGRTVLASHQSTTELLHRQLHDFVTLVTSEGAGSFDAERGLQTMTTIGMCYEALSSGRIAHAAHTADPTPTEGSAPCRPARRPAPQVATRAI